VQKAKELQPDLILLDIGLPKLHGIEAARRISKLSPNSKILFISENRSPEIASEALRAGGSGYLAKSDAGSGLWPAMEAVLQGKQFFSARLAGHDLTGATDGHITNPCCVQKEGCLGLFPRRPFQNLLWPKGNASMDDCTATWLGLDQKRPIHQSNAFAHADQPQTSLIHRSFGVKASS